MAWVSRPARWAPVRHGCVCFIVDRRVCVLGLTCCVRATGFPTQPKTATWSPASRAWSPSKTSSGTSGAWRSCGARSPRLRWSGSRPTNTHTSTNRGPHHNKQQSCPSSPCRRLMDIVNAHRSTDFRYKLTALELFKHTVSVEAPEFCDNMQKVSHVVWRFLLLLDVWMVRPLKPSLCVQDAHEFLTTVLYQIRSLSPLLEQIAASKGRRYTCPVEEHLLFKMQTVRTCRRWDHRAKQRHGSDYWAVLLWGNLCEPDMPDRTFPQSAEFISNIIWQRAQRRRLVKQREILCGPIRLFTGISQLATAQGFLLVREVPLDSCQKLQCAAELSFRSKSTAEPSSPASSAAGGWTCSSFNWKMWPSSNKIATTAHLARQMERFLNPFISRIHLVKK